MKRIISLAAICISLSFTSLLFAQVEIKSTSTKNDSDKKTESNTTNTTNTGTDQKVNMGGGGYTKSGTQINPPATTQEPAKDPSSVKTDTDKGKSLPPASGKVIYDRVGEVFMTIGPDGKMFDSDGELLGQYTAKGDYLDPNGELLATNRDGVIKSKSGKEIGRISKDGKVTNAKGKLLGTIYDDGTIRNSKGSSLGKAPGVDKNITAYIFFQKKKHSGEKDQEPQKKPTFESKPIEKK
jgi:hypothetical protein